MHAVTGTRVHKRKRRQGFTLVEMLIVIVILGILAMVIIPQITSSTDEARISTLQANLSAMRSAVEIYYAQHGGKYPGDSAPATKPADVGAPLDEVLVAQMTRYTDVAGNIANAKDATFKFGPYIKGAALPMNPFNEDSGVVVDNATADITAKASDGTTGWKFYSKTGVLLANDGSHDTD